MSDTILVSTTFEKKEEALALARVLLKKRLIACAQVSPAVDSLYWWQGKMVETKEIRLLMKSRQGLWEELVAEIKRLHSYEVPEIVSVAVSALSTDYKEWLQGVLK